MDKEPIDFEHAAVKRIERDLILEQIAVRQFSEALAKLQDDMKRTRDELRELRESEAKQNE